MAEPRVRGLPSLEEARAERRRAIVFGRVRLRAMPPQFWLIAGDRHRRVRRHLLAPRAGQARGAEERGDGEAARHRADARTRRSCRFATASKAGSRELAGTWPGDFVEPGTSLETISQEPGRVPAAYARERQGPEPRFAKRRAHRCTTASRRACSCSTNAADPTKGPACRSPADCAAGPAVQRVERLCAAAGAYNMRLAYRTLRVLSTEWTDELHADDNDLTVSAYDRDLDAVTRERRAGGDRSAGARQVLHARARRGPEGGLPSRRRRTRGDETDEERVQRAAHFARVGIWDLADGQTAVSAARRGARAIRAPWVRR